MTEKPWFPFNPADWLSETSLQTCSLAAQGLWFQMICAMRRGGTSRCPLEKDMTKFAESVRAKRAEVKRLIKELENAGEKGVFSRDPDGVIFCRRVRRELAKEQSQEKDGKKGGRPTSRDSKCGAENHNPPLSEKHKGSSSSSSSSCSSSCVKERDCQGGENEAEKIRRLWCEHRHETGQAPCHTAAPRGEGLNALLDEHQTTRHPWPTLRRCVERYFQVQDPRFIVSLRRFFQENVYAHYLDDDWKPPKPLDPEKTKPKPKPKTEPEPIPENIAEAADVWEAIRDQLQIDVDPENYLTWIASIECLGRTDDTLYLACCSAFNQSWLRLNFQDRIIEAGKEYKIEKIDIRVEPRLDDDENEE